MLHIIEPQYIVDSSGNKIAAVLPIADYEALLEALEDAEDIRAFDEARADPNPNPLPLDEAFAEIARMAAERDGHTTR